MGPSTCPIGDYPGRGGKKKSQMITFPFFLTVSTSMLSSPNGFSSDLHLIQQLETRRVLGLVELEDDVADLRFQL